MTRADDTGTHERSRTAGACAARRSVNARAMRLASTRRCAIAACDHFFRRPGACFVFTARTHAAPRERRAPRRPRRFCDDQAELSERSGAVPWACASLVDRPTWNLPSRDERTHVQVGLFLRGKDHPADGLLPQSVTADISRSLLSGGQRCRAPSRAALSGGGVAALGSVSELADLAARLRRIQWLCAKLSAVQASEIRHTRTCRRYSLPTERSRDLFAPPRHAW
jgi:hypothetical protein